MRLFIATLLLTILMGCSQQKKTVSLLIYNNQDTFINEMTEYIKKEFNNEYELKIMDSQNFQITQNEFIESRIKAKDDLIIINPVDRLGAYSIIKKLKEKNIPVVFFNREPLAKDLNLWDKAFYVGTKGEQSATLQADLVENIFGSDPLHLNNYDRNRDNIIDLVILKGEQGHQDAEIRTSEVINSLKKRGYNLNILVTEVANWSRTEAMEKMDTIVEEFQDSIELIISNNDSMAIGAIISLRKAGFFKEDKLWVPIIGIDGLKETYSYIESGYLAGTVLNDSQAQAKAIVELTELILGKRTQDNLTYKLENDKYILVDYKIIQ